MSPEANANFSDDYQLPEPPPEEPSFDVPDIHDAGFSASDHDFREIAFPGMILSIVPGTRAGVANSNKISQRPMVISGSLRMTEKLNKASLARC